MHYLDLRVTKAELAREFKISRRTNDHWSETGQLDRELAAGRTQYAPRSRPTHKVDRYRWDHRCAAGRVSEAVVAAAVRRSGGRRDYEGSYGRVRDHVRSVRPQQPVAAAVRFETPPGVGRAGLDFGTFTLPWAGDVRCWWCW